MRLVRADRIAPAVESWLLTPCPADRRSTLVFTISIKHVHAVTATFQARGIDARCVTQRTKQAERLETYRAFRAGEFPVLVNCGILTEGGTPHLLALWGIESVLTRWRAGAAADFPEIDCVILARPTCSHNLYIQMLGRGLRLSPASGKVDCLALDLVASKRSVDLVNVATLFGLEPLEPIQGMSPLSYV